MPQFVTPIAPPRHTPPDRVARDMPAHASPRAPRGYRRRLADLRARAPDTLRARVRRELREAAASRARSE